jgi:hypothetical protein
MTELAELRMHLQDENCKLSTAKERLKRKLTSHGSGATTVEPPASQDDASMPNEELEDSTDPSASDSPQGPSCSTSSFTSVANQLITAHSPLEDLDLNEAEPDGTVTTVQILMSEMFDFTNTYWTKTFKGSLMHGLTEEMELHELLDLDAEGDVDYADNEADLSQPAIDTECIS